MSVCGGLCVYVYVKVEYQKNADPFLFWEQLDQRRLTDAIHPAGIVPVVVPGHRTTTADADLLMLLDDDMLCC